MKLTLIRHAKSSWGDPSQPDHARPLNTRGRDAAPRIGHWLAQNDHLPDLILCSDAARTRETCALISPLIGTPPVKYLGTLYHAEPHQILDALQTHGTDNCALIGHNPGIGALAHMLARTPPNHPRFADYPTAATTVLNTNLTVGQAQVIAFATPHDL